MAHVARADLVELAQPLPPNSLVNPDLAPTPLSARTWGRWHIASLWVGMSVCIPTYMLAASMIQAGMTWWQSLAAIVLGNAIVLVPMIVNAHAGTRYGIPFPVYARAAYGPRGAHLPALLRAVVACGWFGIQTWIGGLAVTGLIAFLWPGWTALGGDWRLMGYGLPEYSGFLIFWVANFYFVWAGTESIKWMETLSAPFLLAAGLALLVWAMSRVGGLGVILGQSAALTPTPRPEAGGWLFGIFVPWLTAMVGYWATLSLNIPDFTRYARSQADQAVGQAVGLLTTMPLFAFIGIAVTSATVLLYGEAIWNPVDLVTRLAGEYRNPLLGVLAMFAILVATITTNVAANIVAPANSFANLSPGRIGFRAGGLIAGVLGIVILPWRLLDMYQSWLIAYSGLLGAVGGVIMCDYVVIRRGKLRLADLYRSDGAYAYTAGVNRAAIIATGFGVLVALLGLVVPGLGFLFSGAWFSATIASFLLYYALMRKAS
ncbi:MAG TPA: NCS1 family nucleobase:cation symporter-1 [Gemmatimonadales bacterium]|nr:NCS1 family nucleobase:cation symporter-1 [Gemmatimonadales bacterium]